jgi:hypothetical protein
VERIEGGVSPWWLAHVFGIHPKTLRHWLRQEFPQKAPGKGHRWVITAPMGRRMYLRRRKMRRTL